MASLKKSEKKLENSMKELKLGLKSKESAGNLQGGKDGSSCDAMSCISSGDATSSVKGSEVDQEALPAEQIMYYPVNTVYGYYYPGFDSSMGDWEDGGYYVGTDGFEIQHAATQSENEPFVYYFPGYQAGYSPYGPLSSGAMVGVDGQYYTQHLYQPNAIYHQPLASSGFVPQSVAYGQEFVPTYVWDSPPMWGSGQIHGNGYGRDPTPPYSKPNYSSQNHTLIPSNGSIPAVSAPQNTVIHNQAHKSTNKVNNELSKGFVQTNKCNSYPNSGKNGLLIPSISGNLKTSGKTWFGEEKLKGANQPQDAGVLDMLNEQNCGPRSVDNSNGGSLVASIKKEDCNLPDFATKYDHAFFFVIKSYSEDDVHKSIKYNVWASTPNGNKRLDNAYQVALEKAAEKGSICPVFLFFSVNASGQFCGLAEMTGRVDFTKSMDFWQQDKWNGYFPVKWHIIKDVPNPQFRHIILENNENKPVTNSRDTQEVKFPQGSEMLNIFKNYSAKTSILDDFGFYESRQKAMQDKRIKPPNAKFEYPTLKTEPTVRVTKPQSDPKAAVPPILHPLEAGGGKAKEELQAESVPQ
ncbi:hypothetical protein KSP39_PZI001485 [Platanthera zijinensis]|uniref:YTH domain-containing family protein n=1 Tax=Platanthera zijinensis TaxID=2320716 RepID=A0AAP0C1U0_9ASPA